METEGQARDARQKAILDALGKGNTRRAAAAYAGCGHDSLYRWMRDDRTFSDAVLKAEADAEMESVRIVRAAGIMSWQAAAWFLERNPRTKQDWKRPDELDLRKLTVEQLLALERALEEGVESPGDRAAQTADSSAE